MVCSGFASATAAACVVLAAGGCGGAEERPAATASPIRTEIVGGSAEQRELLREILAGMGETRIEAIRIGKPDKGWKPFGENDVALAVTTAGQHDFRAEWEAWIVAGVFRDRSREQNLPGVVVLEVSDDASRIDPGPNSPRPPRGDADAIAAEIRRAAADARASVKELALLRPDGIAPAVTLEVPDPAAFLKNRLASFLDATDPWPARSEGRYVEVVDEDGRWAFRAGNSTRLSMGGSGARRGLEGCDPIVHSRPHGYEPPPCPA